MQWEILTSGEALAAIASEWEALHQRAGRTIFTGHAWIDGWWRYIGEPSGAALFIVAGRSEGKLAAIAPLAVRRRSGIRLLEWAAGAVCDYSDFLLERPEDAPGMWDYIRRHAPCDLAQIKEVHPEAACLPALTEFAKPVRTSEARSLRFEWASLDAWLAALPYAVRKQYRARLRQAEAVGPLRYEVQRQVADDALGRLVTQKAALLKAQGRRGIFDGPGAADFFRTVIAAESRSGRLHFSVLYCGDHPIATHLGFVDGDRFLSYMPSYDARWSHLSPGRLMMFRCIGWAMENGLKEFDYMRGEEQYKGRFSNHERVLGDFMFARTLRGRAAMFFHLRRLKSSAMAAGTGADEA